MCFGGASSLVGGFGGSIRLNNHHSHTQPAQIQGHRVYLMSKEEKPTTTTNPLFRRRRSSTRRRGSAAAHTTPDGPKAQFGSTAFFFYCRAGRAALSFPRRENQPGFAVRRMAPRTTKRVKEEEGEAREGGGNGRMGLWVSGTELFQRHGKWYGRSAPCHNLQTASQPADSIISVSPVDDSL